MPALPWLGLLRGLFIGVWPGPGGRAAQQGPPPGWVDEALRRRLLLLSLVVLLGMGAALIGPSAGIAFGWPLLLMGLLIAWVGIGLVTAVMGAWVIWHGDPYAVMPVERGAIHRDARTAIVMPICNEDIATVFGGLRATCESLAATGALPLFDIYVLSDTPDPVLQQAEQRAWQEMRLSLGDGPDAPGGRIFYRARRHRSARKAGNIADFCRRWGRNYRYMVVLDADSVMSGDTLVAMVRTMEHHPRAGILQTLPQSLGLDTLHARTQQFAVRICGRLFAQGLAYWQMGESHFWGHNAILRMQPFMEHCRMAPLPGRGGLSGHILSHDFVEAALMRRAGFEVWLLPSLGGSWEQTPSNMLDELQRDRRWCQGNLQNARLIAEPGWRPAHRAMFATGVLSYLVAPLWLASLASSVFVLVRHPAASGAVLGLWAITVLLLMLPRVIGVAMVLLQRRQQDHGGATRLLASAGLEAVVSALQAPVRMLAHTGFIVSALTGLRLEWKSPPRDARAVRWTDAAARVGLPTVLLLAAGIAWLPGAREGAWSLAPVLLALVLAVPMVVATGHSGLGAMVRRLGLLMVAEELRAPRPVWRARSALAFESLQPAKVVPPPVRAAVSPRPCAPASMPWRGAFSAITAGVMLFAMFPRDAVGPEPAQGQWQRRDVASLWQPQWQSPAQWQSQAQWQSPFEVQSREDPIVVSSLSTPTPTTKAKRSAAPYRPARFIDDAVRERAMRAVQDALAREGSMS